MLDQTIENVSGTEKRDMGMVVRCGRRGGVVCFGLPGVPRISVCRDEFVIYKFDFKNRMQDIGCWGAAPVVCDCCRVVLPLGQRGLVVFHPASLAHIPHSLFHSCPRRCCAGTV